MATGEAWVCLTSPLSTLSAHLSHIVVFESPAASLHTITPSSALATVTQVVTEESAIATFSARREY